MSDGGDWGGLNLWNTIMTGVAMLGSFVVGAWTRGASAGKSEGTLEGRVTGLAQRIDRLESRHDNQDAKVSLMAERIAQMPTRTEMAQGFDRLELRFDNLVRGREN